ncbi:hypothetical protein Nepgr_013541 [Nepenthes gracilis]|uniref:Uncharacterized protein n=1 Tax=Nepenthes gracilis TaxID=150966 RepID=A0AAD3XPI1_NEPGR|nr:hypothetical protein Nepgr_013541 [Nepenthes gracilis]
MNTTATRAPTPAGHYHFSSSKNNRFCITAFSKPQKATQQLHRPHSVDQHMAFKLPAAVNLATVGEIPNSGS